MFAAFSWAWIKYAQWNSTRLIFISCQSLSSASWVAFFCHPRQTTTTAASAAARQAASSQELSGEEEEEAASSTNWISGPSLGGRRRQPMRERRSGGERRRRRRGKTNSINASSSNLMSCRCWLRCFKRKVFRSPHFPWLKCAIFLNSAYFLLRQAICFSFLSHLTK